MADNADTSADVDVENIDLLTTPLGPQADVPEGDTADTSQKDGADTQDKPADDAKPAADAKGTEAKDTDAKESPASDTPADDQKTDEQQQELTPEQQRQADRAKAQMEYQNRQRTRQQIAQQLDQAYGPKTQEQLEQEGLDPQQAGIEALRQEMAYKEQRAYVAELNAGMQAEAVNVTNDYPVFNPNSKEFDPEFTAMVEQQYKTAARLQVDEQGIITNAEVPLYDFYQRMASIYSRGTSKGAQQGQAEMQQMMSRTENPGGSSSTSGNSGNSLEEMEERLGNVRLA